MGKIPESALHIKWGIPRKSPPFEGGVPASLSEQAGWFKSRNHPTSSFLMLRAIALALRRSVPLLQKEGSFGPLTEFHSIVAYRAPYLN